MRVLPGLGERLLHGLVERVRTQVGAVLYLQLEAAQCAHAANGGRGEDHDEGPLNTGPKLRAKRVRDGAPREVRRGALVKVREWKKKERRTGGGGESVDRHCGEPAGRG